MSAPDVDALWLTLKLAAVVTAILLVVSTPIAWRLARSRAAVKPFVEALVALPLVLPPTVLGFYLLVAFNPEAPLGAIWFRATGETLAFSFPGLVVASVVYSLPFSVQPLQSAFEDVPEELMEAAASLRATPLDAFFSVAAPLSARGFLTAGVLAFAHTLGEFGIVLMVGGSIPDRTRVASIAIYENVETLQYEEAHVLSAVLLALCFLVLLSVFVLNRRRPIHGR